MKRFLYVLVIVICSVATTAYGQSISGKLTTEGWSKSIQISSHEPVSLFKNFRDGKHKILFHFKSTAGEKAIVLFQMKTTLIHNGKTVVVAIAQIGHGYQEICMCQWKLLILYLSCRSRLIRIKVNSCLELMKLG